MSEHPPSWLSSNTDMSILVLKEIKDAFREATQEPSITRARALLRRVRNGYRELLETRHGIEAAIIASQATRELADIEVIPGARLNLRKKACSILRTACESEPRNSIAPIEYARQVVNLVQDRLIPDHGSDARSLLVDALRRLDNALESEGEDTRKSSMLSTKSALLRSQSRIERRSLRSQRAASAMRCAKKAIELDAENMNGFLQHGLALWLLGNQSRLEEDRHSLLLQAEKSLHRSSRDWKPANTATLALFYLATDRPAQSIEVYEYYRRCETNLRRGLRNNYIFGRAVLQLYLSAYPHEIVHRNLKKSLPRLRHSIDSGYEDARLLITLASLEAACGDPELSLMTLIRLDRTEAISFLDILDRTRSLIEAGDHDLLTRAFALGIADPETWSQLGDYAINFLHDPSLAAKLYETGARLMESSFILTRLASALILIGGHRNFDRADYFLRRAGLLSPRMYQGWRSVRLDLDRCVGKVRRIPLKAATGARNRLNLKDLYRAYIALNWHGLHALKRKRLLEELAFDRFTLILGVTRMPNEDGKESTYRFAWRGREFQIYVHTGQTKLGENELEELSLEDCQNWIILSEAELSVGAQRFIQDSRLGPQ